MAGKKVERKAQPDPEPVPLFVFGMNVKAVELFAELNTQWVYTGLGVITGLNYPSVEMVMRTRRIPAKDRPSLFEKIRVMESAALKILQVEAKGDSTDRPTKA